MWVMGTNNCNTQTGIIKRHSAPFMAIKTNTAPPVRRPAGLETRVCVWVRGGAGQMKTKGKQWCMSTCKCFTSDLQFCATFDLSAFNFRSTAHELVYMVSIWPKRICYKHHFSGDKLMHWPNCSENCRIQRFLSTAGWPLNRILISS